MLAIFHPLHSFFSCPFMHEKERSCVILRYGHKDMQYMHARDEEGGVNIVVKYARKFWFWGGIRCRCNAILSKDTAVEELFLVKG